MIVILLVSLLLIITLLIYVYKLRKNNIKHQSPESNTTLDVPGPSSLGGGYQKNTADYAVPLTPLAAPYKYNTSNKAYAYDPKYPGPVLGLSMNIPVPRDSLKIIGEHYKFPFYYNQKPLPPYDYFKPFGPNQEKMQSTIVDSDIPFYARNNNTYALPYTGQGQIPFVGSVSAFAPFPEVTTPWEKVGLLTNSQNHILSLYRRPIAPLQDLWNYTVQDKDGFIIPLKQDGLIKDGDMITDIVGKTGLGPWKVHIFVKDKWVWV